VYAPVASVTAVSVPLGPVKLTVTPASGDSPGEGAAGLKLGEPAVGSKKT
jgi:hypothetical protein